MAVTLKILSEKTGFSSATISRVLNNDPSMTVSEDTRRIFLIPPIDSVMPAVPVAVRNAFWQTQWLLALQKCSLPPSK